MSRFLTGTSSIYILEHFTKTTIKVGRTENHPKDRLVDYCKKHGLENFRLAKIYPCFDKRLVQTEKNIHRELKEYRLSSVSNAKEIFSCSIKIAEPIILKNIHQSILDWAEEDGKLNGILDDFVRTETESVKHYEYKIKQNALLKLPCIYCGDPHDC